MHLTASALKWQLAAPGKLELAKARSLPQQALRNNSHETKDCTPSTLFVKRFAQVIGCTMAGGHVLVRCTVVPFDLMVEDLARLFPTHKIEQSVDL